MKSNQRGVVWPYLLVLFGLFALSISAPRAWKNASTGVRAELSSVANPFVPKAIQRDEANDTVSQVPALRFPGAGQREFCPAQSAELEPEQCDETDVKWSTTAPGQLYPLVVTPLREFSRRVIDPIVEFAKRPTTLQTLPDLAFPRFEPTDPVATAVPRLWSRPTSLLADLESLRQHEETAAWAEHVARLIDELCVQPAGSRPEHVVIADLGAAVQRDAMPAPQAVELQSELSRTRYALIRRLEIWDRLAITAPDGSHASKIDPAAADEALAAALASVERLTASVQSGDAWREYLLLADLQLLQRNPLQPREAKRALAETVIARLEAARQAQAQRGFVSKQPFDQLRQQLVVWSADPIAWPRVLQHLEDYEQARSAADARALALASQVLRLTGNELDRELGERLDLHYRNANLRFSVSTELLNRLIPQPQTLVSGVNDSVQGVPLRGRSTTFTKLAVHTIPDRNRVRFGLEADGIIASSTTSDAGMARFFNRSESNFQVRKLLVFGANGLRSYPAVSNAESYYNNLTDVETSFDGVPLVGALVRGMAISQHDEAAPLARREMESKMARRVREQFDLELENRLAEMMTKADRQVLEPLRQLGLEPTALDLNSSDTRATMRIRLADDHQLAAHTPRPRAPGDSLVSLQIHESTLNNVLDSLDVANREFTVPELYQWLGKKLHHSKLTQPDDVPDDVVVRFAAEEPLRVRLADGQMELVVRLAKLTHNRKRWRDFTVRARYQPDEDSRAARLVRSGAIWLEGESLQGRAEFVLRSILSRALSVERPWQIVPLQMADDKRLADLDIAQFVVEDGWLGLAYARRATEQTNVAGQPTSLR